MASRIMRTGIGMTVSLMLLFPLIQSYASGDASNDDDDDGITIDGSTVETIIVLGKQGFDDASPSSIAIDRGTNLVYVSNRNSDSVSVINATTNRLAGSIAVGYSPGDLAVNSNTNMVYVTKPGFGSVVVIDGLTNRLVKTIELPANSTSRNYSIGGIAVNERTNKVYVLTHNFTPEGGERADYALISIIDGSTNEIDQSFKVADLRFDYDVGDDPRGIAINSRTNTIYAVLMFGDMYVIDGNTNTVAARVAIGYEKMPHQVSVNEETNMVYTSNFGNQSISVVNGSTNEVVKTIPVGYDPQGMAVDAATNTIYLVMYGGNVAVIDGSSSSLLGGVMPVQEFPERAAFDENNGYLYVTNTGSNTVSAIDTKQAADKDGWKTARIFISSEGFSNATIRYKLSSGAIETPYIDMNGQRQVQRDVIVADTYFPSLTIPINSSSPGTLVIELPRSIIDSKMNGSTITDSEFSSIIRAYPGPVLRPAAFEELNKTDTARVLSIKYPPRLSNEMSDQVEVIINGQLSIPEFSSSAAIIAMALSIGVATLALSRRQAR